MEPVPESGAPKYGSNSQVRCRSRALQAFLPTNAPPGMDPRQFSRVFDRELLARQQGPRSPANIRMALHTPGIVWSPQLLRMLQNMVLTVKLDANPEHCSFFAHKCSSQHGPGSMLSVFNRPFSDRRGRRSSADIRMGVHTPGPVWIPQLLPML